MKPVRRPRKPESAAAMRPAVIASCLLAALLGGPARAEPISIRSGGIEYVSLADVAASLGLRLEKLVPASGVIIKAGALPVAKLVDHSRDTDIRGLRVFFGDPVITHRGGFYLSRTDYEFHFLPRLRPDLCGTPPHQPHLIVVDAGHGGVDHGTENPRLHTMEKTYTLDVALDLKRLLEGAGYKVMMIREADVTVPLENRSTIANRWSPDLFVSVHFNSTYPNTKTAGVEVMSFPCRGQRSTDSWSPGRKDDAEGADAPVNAYAAWNTVLGSMLHRHLLATLHDGDRGEKYEHLAVLRGLNCPGVLVEPAFLSNDTEGVSLGTPAYRESIAGAIFSGIQDYADEVRRLRPAAIAPAGAAPSPVPARAPSPGAPAHSFPSRPSAIP
jgi:N-acetylmuramoyl-L-alanine amidase